MHNRILNRWSTLEAAIAVPLLLIYARSLSSGFVTWDDDYLIVNNPLIRSLSLHSLWTVFTTYDPELYIPLTFLSYQLNFLIVGLHPFLYHLTNLFLHGGNAMLVAAVAYMLSRKNMWVAVAAGLLFAVHPLHTEAVVWASARKDVLASTFFLSSLLLYLHYGESGKKSTYVWSIVTFLLALLSKVSVITLPLVLLVCDWRAGVILSPSKDDTRRSWFDELTMIAPYFLFSIVFGVIALAGKTQQIAHSTMSESILIAGRSFVFYLEKLFLPLNLSPMYPFVGDVRITSPEFFLPILAIIALIAIAFWSLRRTRDVMFALVFFALTIAPTMVNFRKGEEGDIYIASDRYAYLASFGLIFLVCLFLFRMRERFSAKIINVLAAVMVVVLGSLAFLQARIWKDSEALFTAVVARYPQAQAAHHNLGVVYQKAGHLQDALNQYGEALAIAPKASTEANIGDIFREAGQPADAADHYQKALAINSKNADAYLGLGLLALQDKKTDAAITAFQSAVEFAPQSPETHLNLGAALMSAKRVEEAITEYKKAIELDSSSAAASFNLAVALERAGRMDEARQWYRRAVELDPSFALAVSL
ncbi:tetratricopeptide repeat protein [Candidatus Peribacteria bacterium]|nr:tetratricopeptide repeat protein [Candidatus Peribacteria bacterium]